MPNPFDEVIGYWMVANDCGAGIAALPAHDSMLAGCFRTGLSRSDEFAEVPAVITAPPLPTPGTTGLHVPATQPAPRFR